MTLHEHAAAFPTCGGSSCPSVTSCSVWSWTNRFHIVVCSVIRLCLLAPIPQRKAAFAGLRRRPTHIPHNGVATIADNHEPVMPGRERRADRGPEPRRPAGGEPRVELLDGCQRLRHGIALG